MDGKEEHQKIKDKDRHARCGLLRWATNATSHVDGIHEWLKVSEQENGNRGCGCIRSVGVRDIGNYHQRDIRQL